jgi:catechol 2,3-dioxygenase-like lactoylglutathione lyase family enzyme
MSLVNKTKMEVILFVGNMDAEVRFYRDVLGLPLHFPKGLEDYSDQMWVEFKLGDSSLALHGGSDSHPTDDHQMVFFVDDVVSARERIVEAGISMGEIRPLEDGAPVSEGRDPDGHPFSIRS